jgi:hypothetical protein
MAHYRQFVQSPISPAIVLDVDDHTLVTVQTGSSVSSPSRRYSSSPRLTEHGDHLTSAYFGDRQVLLKLKFVAGSTAAAQSAFLQKLARIVGQGAWLKWQDEGKARPQFFRTKPADVAIVDYILTADPTREITVTLPAEPGAASLPVTGTAVVTNDPTAASNPMMIRFGPIEGDLPTSPQLRFTTPDAAHRIALASCALITALPLVSDAFNRANSATTMGNADTGQAWGAAIAGTFGIDAQRAYVATIAGASLYSYNTIDSGLSDVIIETTIAVRQSDGFTGIRLRGSGANGFSILHNQMWNNAATVGPGFSETFVTGDRMRVEAIGQTITVYRQAAALGGGWTQVMTTTTATYLTQTQHGITAFGSQAGTSRWENFTITPSVQAAPYYKSLVAATKDATPPTGWTITDAADATNVSGNKRTLASSGSVAMIVPTDAVLLQWEDLPIGNYRVWVRVTGIDAGTELLFWNKPPSTGSVLLEEEAAARVTVDVANTGHDWITLGVVAMPGSAPLADAVHGLDTDLGPALWNFGVRKDASMSIDLDAIVLVPAGRPGTSVKQGSVEVPASYTSKTVTFDGINKRRYGKGISALTPGVTSPFMPSDIRGGLPELVPGAANVLHLFATAAAPAAASRIDDSKALTTTVEYTYLPLSIYDHPDA